MCAVCLEFQKGNLTKYEARKALLELINTDQIGLDHTFDVADLIEGDLDESDAEPKVS